MEYSGAYLLYEVESLVLLFEQAGPGRPNLFIPLAVEGWPEWCTLECMGHPSRMNCSAGRWMRLRRDHGAVSDICMPRDISLLTHQLGYICDERSRDPLFAETHAVSRIQQAAISSIETSFRLGQSMPLEGNQPTWSPTVYFVTGKIVPANAMIDAPGQGSTCLSLPMQGEDLDDVTGAGWVERFGIQGNWTGELYAAYDQMTGVGWGMFFDPSIIEPLRSNGHLHGIPSLTRLRYVHCFTVSQTFFVSEYPYLENMQRIDPRSISNVTWARLRGDCENARLGKPWVLKSTNDHRVVGQSGS